MYNITYSKTLYLRIYVGLKEIVFIQMNSQFESKV